MNAQTAIRLRRPRCGGYTLLEALLSTAIAAAVLGGIAGAMLLAQRGTALAADAGDKAAQEARAAQMINVDLGQATAITERTASAITMTVPDRDGSGQPETVRYAWSGTPGAPLTRQFNGGTASVIADNVYRFNLTYVSGRATITETLSPRITVQSAHGARHLAGTGLASEAVESSITGQVRQAVSGATSTGSFWGRVTVGGRVVEYRAVTLPDGTINIGTYYPVNP